MKPRHIGKVISNDKRATFTILSLLSILVILINSLTYKSFLIGAAFSSIYLVINSIFMGDILFKKEHPSFQATLGFLVLLTLIGLTSSILLVIIGMRVLPVRFDMYTIAFILGSITIALSIAKRIQITSQNTKNNNVRKTAFL